MNRLDERLAKHFRQATLTRVQLDDMHRWVANTRKARTTVVFDAMFRHWRRASAAVVCSLMAALLLQHVVLGERTGHALREAAMNHATELNLEFTSDSLAELNQDMRLLPFDLALPSRLHDRYRLLGARYCSISGHLAVHLKLFDTTAQRTVSLFATELLDALKPIGQQQGAVDGITVDLWQERDLFFALAAGERTD